MLLSYILHQMLFLTAPLHLVKTQIYYKLTENPVQISTQKYSLLTSTGFVFQVDV